MNNIWHVQNLPKELILELNRGFLKKVVQSIGSQRSVAKLIKTSHSYLHNLIKGKKCVSIKRVLELIKLSPKQNYFLKNLDKNVIRIKAPSSRSYSIQPNLPIKFSPIFAKILGYIFSDGSVRTSRGHNVRYGDPDFILVANFIHDMESVFGKTKIALTKKKGKTVKFFYEVSFPSVIGRILLHLFGPFGTHVGRVPKLVMLSPKKFRKEFLQAVFDAESTISEKSGELTLSMANKPFVYSVHKMLRNIGIKSSFRHYEHRNIFTVAIGNQKNILKFWNDINLTPNTKKSLRLKEYADFLYLKQLVRQNSKNTSLGSLGELT